MDLIPSALGEGLAAAIDRFGRPLVGVCGLSGAGKTTLCEEILRRFPNRAVHLRGDSFSKYSYRERTRRIDAAHAGDDPALIEAEEHPMNWTDYSGIWAVADALRSGQNSTYERGWNRATGELDRSIRFSPPDSEHYLILIDSIYLLHPAARERLHQVILLKPGEELRNERSARRRHGAATEWSRYIDRLELLYTHRYFQKFERLADWVIS